ncbi:copper chaperone PCu(A)C [Ensifer adhaerens]|uniref:copper chaperone PCu(A)C n=1 Tax=Ensifer adhaerens TaxID=106592 RepID=UPI001C4E1165|nr:copper chaperone PCu(A)C [Ensifer adhaerens]MBW0368318.1 copper chaperone PCu(A)C [Ensifer adhaerens]UCM24940.1 copper chaperone PCu(A)C [Ensifer adhaerens]
MGIFNAKSLLASVGFLSASVTAASADGREAHLAALDEIRVIHPWVRAAEAGGTTLLFMEIENDGGPVRLVSARSSAAGAATTVGIVSQGETLSTVDIGVVEVPRGEFRMDPGGLAIRLERLSEDFAVDEEIDVVLTFEPGGELPLRAKVEAADATEHRHAGHAHH